MLPKASEDRGRAVSPDGNSRPERAHLCAPRSLWTGWPALDLPEGPRGLVDMPIFAGLWGQPPPPHSSRVRVQDLLVELECEEGILHGGVALLCPRMWHRLGQPAAVT